MLTLGEEGALAVGSSRQGFAMRVDTAGQTLWALTLTNLQSTVARRANDGTFVIAGSMPVTASDGTTDLDFGLVRVSAVGVELERRRIDSPLGPDRAEDAQELPDGGWVLVGDSFAKPAGDKTAPNRGAQDGWVVRLDQDLQPVWDQTYGGAEAEFLRAGAALADGGLYLAGWSASSPGGNKTAKRIGLSDAWLVRTDPAGAPLWDRVYGSSAEDWVYCLAPAADGDLLLGGFTQRGTVGGPLWAWLFRVSAEGALRWERFFDARGYGSVFAVQELPDGRWAALVHTGGPAAVPQLDLICLGGDGQPLWRRTLEGSALSGAGGLGLSVDGSLLVVATSPSGRMQISRVNSDTVPAPLAGPPVLFSLEGYWLEGSAGAPSFSLVGSTGRSYAIEASADLQTWESVATNRIDRTDLKFGDPGGGAAPGRFFRARELPSAAD